MKNTLIAALAVSASLSFSGIAGAADYYISGWVEPNHLMSDAHREWAAGVSKATNGEINFEVFTAGALIPAASTQQGVADGLAQAGMHAAAYTPSNNPIGNALGDFGFINPNPYVLAFAYSDYMFNDPVGNGEWRKNGVIYGGSHSTPKYDLLCNRDVQTLADIQGLKVRTAGGGWARAATALGMVPVKVTGTEMYMAMDTGAVDCASADITHIDGGASLGPLLKSVLNVSFTPAYNTAMWVYNPDFWKSLTPDQRRILLDQTAIATVHLLQGYDRAVAENRKHGEEMGIKFHDPDPTLRAAIDKWVDDGVGGMADVARTNFGIEDPDALFTTFGSYVDKWDALLKDVDYTDDQQLIAILKTNLYDKIDVSSYGLE